MTDNAEEIVAQIERLGRLARAAQHEEGMKPVQWEVLRYLSRARKQSRNPGALADFLSSTRGTVSQTLIALEKKGLIKRLNCGSDGRAKRLELTPAAHEMLTRDPMEKFTIAVSELGEATVLLESLKGIVNTLVAQNGTNSFGDCRNCSQYVIKDLGGICRPKEMDIPAEEAVQLCRDFEPLLTGDIKHSNIPVKMMS